MKLEGSLRNNLKQTRTRLGLSQQDLAELAGVTRQTISGAESGQYAPSTTIALRLARVLGCPVESLFWLEEDLPETEATAARGLPAGTNLRVALARVGGRWVAHPLMGREAYRTEMVPADGEGRLEAGLETVRVRLLDDPQNLLQTVALAGCTPALSLWARAAERWNPGLRVHWIFANSMSALDCLRRGEVHGAGVHLYDPETGEFNLPFVRQALPGRAAVLINLGFWEEGFAVRPGNPLAIKSAADLAQDGVSIINREPGAGARHLLEHELRRAGVPAGSVQGFDRVVCGHTELAAEIAAGRADAGVTTASVAASYGLDFVPVHQVRYDMVFPQEYLEEQPVRQLLGSLSHRWVRSQLAAIGGYDTSRTGEVVGTVEA